MGFQACNTGSLDLGLGLTANSQESCSPTPPNKSHHSMRKAATSFEPSLTLGLSGNSFHEDDHLQGNNNNSVHELYNRQSGSPNNSHSAVSNSFSSGVRVVKRERDLSSEEAEVEKLSGRAVSDEDEDGPNARKKLRLTKDQSALLEESFKQHSTLNPKQKQALARQLILTPRQVEVWFQNRRARTKLKQTEVDCELLKKCCETLTDENRRLQKEVQELKALKQQQQQPLFMHMPAATLTMCPSCERIGSGVGSEAAANSNKIPFSMAHPKPHFYNPFTNSSAAC